MNLILSLFTFIALAQALFMIATFYLFYKFNKLLTDSKAACACAAAGISQPKKTIDLYHD